LRLVSSQGNLSYLSHKYASPAAVLVCPADRHAQPQEGALGSPLPPSSTSTSVWFRWVPVPPEVIVLAVRWYLRYGRPCRHAPGDRWFADETYRKVAGRWVYLYRAIDQFGQVIDVLLSEKRDLAATRRFFTRALKHGLRPGHRGENLAPLRDQLAAGNQVIDHAAQEHGLGHSSSWSSSELSPSSFPCLPPRRGVPAESPCP
jgi:DDE domain